VILGDRSNQVFKPSLHVKFVFTLIQNISHAIVVVQPVIKTTTVMVMMGMGNGLVHVQCVKSFRLVDVNAPQLLTAGSESGMSVYELEVIRNHIVTRLPSLLEAEASVI